MPERIVVCLCEPAHAGEPANSAVLEHSRALIGRAKIFGATLCAWSVGSLAFSFLVDDLEEAVEFVASADTRELAKPFGVCVMRGSLELLVLDPTIELGSGPVMHAALSLAQLALPGEVLIERGTIAFHRVHVNTVGSRSIPGPLLSSSTSSQSSPDSAGASVGGTANLSSHATTSETPDAKPAAPSLVALSIDVDRPFRTLDDLSVSASGEPTPQGSLDKMVERMADLSTDLLSASPPNASLCPALAERRAFLDALQSSVGQFSSGTVATLRSGSGLGASRFLRALTIRNDGARCLMLTPSGHGMEPLGALRRAFARATALRNDSALSSRHEQTKRRLFDGLGASPTEVAELLEHWLEHPIDSGLLVIDDVSGVDGSTLEVVAMAVRAGGSSFRTIVRIDYDSPLPAALASLPKGPEIRLSSFSGSDAARLATFWTGGLFSGSAAEDWARHAGCNPLVLGEVLAEALASRLVGSNADIPDIQPRPPLNVATIASSVSRRLHVLPQGSRSVLFALATLGGDSPVGHIARVVEFAADTPVDIATEQSRLVRSGWLCSPQPGWLGFCSRSQLQAVVESIPDTKRGVFHRAAAGVVASDGPLQLAESAWHIASAGEQHHAKRLAQHAAIQAQIAGLDSAARELQAFARAQDVIAKRRFGFDHSGVASHMPMTAAPGEPEDIFPVALAARSPKCPDRNYFPPISRIDQPSLRNNANTEIMPDIDKLVSGTASTRLGGKRIDGRGGVPNSERVTAIGQRMSDSSRVPESGAIRALRTATSGEFEAWSHKGSGSARLVERIRALSELKRGKHTDAITTLRNACDQSRLLPSIERSRCHLAYAIGLARAARPLEALVEGIEALARARESADPKAESACVAFLRLLYDDQNRVDGANWLLTIAR